jgi:hypothetical protein
MVRVEGRTKSDVGAPPSASSPAGTRRAVRHLLGAGVFAVSGALLVAAPGVSALARPVTPKAAQQTIRFLLRQIGAPDVALVPTRVPPHFAFESYSVTGSPPGLDVTFADQRFLKSADQARQHEISFDTQYLGRTPRGCAAGSRTTLRVVGVAVYANRTTVWRCTTTARGHLVKVSASGPASHPALAVLVVSARPVQ